MPCHFSINTHSFITFNGSINNKILKCVLEFGSTISALLYNIFKTLSSHSKNTSPKKKLNLNKICKVPYKIGNLCNRVIILYILNSDLPYAILGLEDCVKLELNINCSNFTVAQNGLNVNNIQDAQRTLLFAL